MQYRRDEWIALCLSFWVFLFYPFCALYAFFQWIIGKIFGKKSAEEKNTEEIDRIRLLSNEKANEEARQIRIYKLIVGTVPLEDEDLAQWHQVSLLRIITILLLYAVQTFSLFIHSLLTALQYMPVFCCSCWCKSNDNDFIPIGASGYVTVEFNAWAYSGSDLLWASIIKELWDAVESKYGKTAVRMHRASIALAGESPFKDLDESPLEEPTKKRNGALLKFHMMNIGSAILFVALAALAFGLAFWLSSVFTINEEKTKIKAKNDGITTKNGTIMTSILTLLALCVLLNQLVVFLKYVLPYLRKARGDYILEKAKESSK